MKNISVTKKYPVISFTLPEGTIDVVSCLIWFPYDQLGATPALIGIGEFDADTVSDEFKEFDESMIFYWVKDEQEFVDIAEGNIDGMDWRIC